MLPEEETSELVFAVVHGQACDRLQGYRLAPGEGIAGWVATNRVPQTVTDVRLDPRFSPMVDETFGFHTRSLSCVPLLDGDRGFAKIGAILKTNDFWVSHHHSPLLMVVAQLAG